MAVMAPEAEAALGGAASGGGAGGGASPAAAGGGGMPQVPVPSPSPPSKTALLALGILLLWLAGLGFFFCFEGLMVQSADTSGGGLVRALFSGLAGKTQDLESANAKQGGSGG